MEDDKKPVDIEAMAEGLAESIAYNKRVYDTFRGGEDGMLGVRKTVKLHSKKSGIIVLYQVWKTNDAKFILTVDPMGDSWANSYAYWSDESGCEYDPGDAIAVSGDRGFVGCLESLGYTILHDG